MLKSFSGNPTFFGSKSAIRKRTRVRSQMHTHRGSSCLSRPESDRSMQLSAFPTELGWMAIVGQNESVNAVFIGHSTRKSVEHRARQFSSQLERAIEVEDWFPDLREQLVAYAEGELIDFTDIQLESIARTRFQEIVVERTRRIPYGETTTYGDLARNVGHPGAARAVGTVMSTNRFPIIIPCHRVLASGGKLGGYTAPSGLDLKRKMLELERNCHQ